MRKLACFVLLLFLLNMVAACSPFRKENPLNVKCPSCGYIWDYSITR